MKGKRDPLGKDWKPLPLKKMAGGCLHFDHIPPGKNGSYCMLVQWGRGSGEAFIMGSKTAREFVDRLSAIIYFARCLGMRLIATERCKAGWTEALKKILARRPNKETRLTRMSEASFDEIVPDPVGVPARKVGK